MHNKKIILSITTSAAIAASFAAADRAEAAAYKVKSGDSLWTIAQKYKTSIPNLKSINKLKADTIYVGQVIQTSGSTKKPTTISKKPAVQPAKSSTTSSSYKVQDGDTLSGIAYKYKMSLDQLLKLNNLTTTIIFPGQTLKVSGKVTAPAPAKPVTPVTKPQTPTSSKPSSTYTVANGDSLSVIAKRFGVSVSTLKSWNKLNSDMIFVGQKLSIKGSTPVTTSPGNVAQTSKPSSGSDYNVNTLISAAKSQLGTPYVWGGATPNGFDCSGFIQYTYNKAGKSIARYSAAGYFDRSAYVSNPKVGDLVFFKNTYTTGISHLGIYLGGGNFIHAGGDRVQISNVSNSYWNDHFDSYKRLY